MSRKNLVQLHELTLQLAHRVVSLLNLRDGVQDLSAALLHDGLLEDGLRLPRLSMRWSSVASSAAEPVTAR